MKMKMERNNMINIKRKITMNIVIDINISITRQTSKHSDKDKER